MGYTLITRYFIYSLECLVIFFVSLGGCPVDTNSKNPVGLDDS